MTKDERAWNGRHVFLMFAGAFGVIILANLALTIAAVRSFPGMDIKNSYVASQQFERKRQMQEQLGFRSFALYDGNTLEIGIDSKDGVPAELAWFSARVGRPTHQRSDLWPEFHFDGRHHTTTVELDPGYWNLDISANSLDGQPFQQKLTLWVSTRHRQ